MIALNIFPLNFPFFFFTHGHLGFSTEPSRTGSASVSPKPLENRTNILTVRSGIREYRNKMEEKAIGQNHAAFRLANNIVTHLTPSL